MSFSSIWALVLSHVTMRNKESVDTISFKIITANKKGFYLCLKNIPTASTG